MEVTLVHHYAGNGNHIQDKVQKAEMMKNNIYRSLYRQENIFFSPLVCSTFNNVGPDLARFLYRLAVLQSGPPSSSPSFCPSYSMPPTCTSASELAQDPEDWSYGPRAGVGYSWLLRELTFHISRATLARLRGRPSPELPPPNLLPSPTSGHPHNPSSRSSPTSPASSPLLPHSLSLSSNPLLHIILPFSEISFGFIKPCIILVLYSGNRWISAPLPTVLRFSEIRIAIIFLGKYYKFGRSPKNCRTMKDIPIKNVDVASQQIFSRQRRPLAVCSTTYILRCLNLSEEVFHRKISPIPAAYATQLDSFTGCGSNIPTTCVLSGERPGLFPGLLYAINNSLRVGPIPIIGHPSPARHSHFKIRCRPGQLTR